MNVFKFWGQGARSVVMKYVGAAVCSCLGKGSYLHWLTACAFLGQVKIQDTFRGLSICLTCRLQPKQQIYVLRFGVCVCVCLCLGLWKSGQQSATATHVKRSHAVRRNNNKLCLSLFFLRQVCKTYMQFWSRIPSHLQDFGSGTCAWNWTAGRETIKLTLDRAEHSCSPSRKPALTLRALMTGSMPGGSCHDSQHHSYPLPPFCFSPGACRIFGEGRAKGFDLDKRCLHTVSRMVHWNSFPIPNRRTVWPFGWGFVMVLRQRQSVIEGKRERGNLESREILSLFSAFRCLRKWRTVQHSADLYLNLPRSLDRIPGWFSFGTVFVFVSFFPYPYQILWLFQNGKKAW